MTQFCKFGEQPKLYYKFPGDTQDKIISFEISPIDVSVSNTGSTSNNKCGNTYGTWSMITYDSITASSPFSYKGYDQESPVFNNRTIIAACSNRVIYSDSGFAGGSINARNIIFTSESSNTYTIQVRDIKTNSLIFTDTKQSISPPTYKVICSDECPDGYIKCTTTSYPGYCCIPCDEVKGGIANITAMLRNVTHG